MPNYKIASFYNSHTILKSFNFEVMFNFDKSALSSIVSIEPYQVVDVDIPAHTFNRETVNCGVTQLSFPVLTKPQELNIKITLTEDVFGSVQFFIKKLENTVVSNGIHNFIKNMTLGHISTYLYNDVGETVSAWKFHNVFFLGAESKQVSYSSNEAITYTLNFGTDYIEYWAKGMTDTDRIGSTYEREKSVRLADFKKASSF